MSSSERTACHRDYYWQHADRRRTQRVESNRKRKARSSHMAKYSAEDVRLIRALRDGPQPLLLREIAEKFEMPISTVQRIAARNGYKWVDG